MLLNCYSVFDSKVGAYLPMMSFRSRGEAIRAFASAACDAAHDFNKYASDYTLFEIGSFDDSSAKFDAHLTPIPVGKAIEFLPAQTCDVSGAVLSKVN